MMTIHHGDVDDFLAELDLQAGLGAVSTADVRYSEVLDYTKVVPLAHLKVIATFGFTEGEERRERVCRLSVRAGQVMTGLPEGVRSANDEVLARVARWRARLKAAAGQHGLALRPGIHAWEGGDGLG